MGKKPRSAEVLETIRILRTSEFLNETEAAMVLDLQPQTLRVWRCTGRGPRFMRSGRVVRYRWQWIDRWAAKHEKGGEK